MEGLAGARWWKSDFHTHSPASDDYGKGPDQTVVRKRSPRDWLLDFMRAGIDCVAITDHNTGAWVDLLKEANAALREDRPEGFRSLVLFPGVEINVHGGVHMLAILDPEKDKSDIDQLLGAVGLPDDCTTGSVTSKPPVEVAQVIHERGGLAIPAHIDSTRGILVELNGQSLQEILECQWILAAEAASKDCLKRFHPNPHWSLIVGSDGHHPDDSFGDRYPGSHHAWFKMGKPSIEGLRLALIDGNPLSVLRSDEDLGNPNQYASQVIESITIRDAQYAGRVDPLEACFSPWMTAIVGGRGTGKSTVVEMLRLALRRQDDLPEEIQSDFSEFASLPRNRNDTGALTLDTEAVATVRKDDIRFRVRWRYDGSGISVEEQDTDGMWIRGVGDIRERFPARILSQKQVLALSRDPNSLLKVIDDSPQVARAEWNSRHEELEARFLRFRSELREADARIGARPRLEGNLSDINRQIRVFEEGGHRELLFVYGRYRKERRILNDRLEEMKAAEHRLRELADNLDPTDLPEHDFGDARAAESDVLGLLNRAVAEQRSVQLRLDALANEFADFQQKWHQEVVESPWNRERQTVAQSFASLKERLSREGVEDVTDYGRLVQRRHVIEERLKGLDAFEQQRTRIAARAADTLAEIHNWRTELTKRRLKFCTELLSGNELVKVTLVPLGDNPSLAEADFRVRLDRTDGRLRKDILDDEGGSGILAELYADAPDDPQNRIVAMTNRVAQIKRQICEISGGQTTPERTKWFHTHVRQLRPEQVAHLELWWPEDCLHVEYRRAKSSPFVSIVQGSPGQKSAAILALLLAHGDEPIVLDQPEDDLDNHVIHDLIVRQIRDNKRRRQVIVVTHNPNIVVNGDAEQVIAMDHQNGQCIVVADGTGALQEPGVRDEVCHVMEGGRKAFEARYKRLVSPSGHA